jgi:3',5'-cyclic AMP phosphodiesterase CpdA
VLLAQLTDTHVVDPGGATDELLVDNNRRLELAVERLNAETVRPDVVVATGDLTDHGTTVEAKLLAELLTPLEMPLLALPGNHDARETFRAAFDQPWASDRHLSWAVDVGRADDAVHIIGLDTLQPGSHVGMFDDERRDWLTAALDASSDRTTMIAMHHPPFLTGIRWMDRTALRGMDEFVATVAGRPNVARILCGHIHRPIVTTVAGVTTSVGPSPIHHVELDLEPDAPIELIEDPGAYQLHHHHGGNWVSHIRYVAPANPPVRPAWST